MDEITLVVRIVPAAASVDISETESTQSAKAVCNWRNVDETLVVKGIP